MIANRPNQSNPSGRLHWWLAVFLLGLVLAHWPLCPIRLSPSRMTLREVLC